MESKAEAKDKLECGVQRGDCRGDEVAEVGDGHLVNSSGLCQIFTFPSVELAVCACEKPIWKNESFGEPSGGVLIEYSETGLSSPADCHSMSAVIGWRSNRILCGGGFSVIGLVRCKCAIVRWVFSPRGR
jgi:hypothetical protein